MLGPIHHKHIFATSSKYTNSLKQSISRHSWVWVASATLPRG